MPNYFQIGQVVFDKKPFKMFPFGCHGEQNFAWNSFEIRIIAVKVSKIPVVKQIVN